MRNSTTTRRLLFLAVPALLAWAISGCSTSDLLKTSSTTTPVINSISPSTGVPGATVIIQGANFGTTAGTVAFQDTNQAFMAAPVATWTDTAVVVTVPTMPSGPQAAKVGMQTSAGLVPASAATFNVTRSS